MIPAQSPWICLPAPEDSVSDFVRLAIASRSPWSPGFEYAALGVSEGTRTPDRLDHNQELYQLSYAHQDQPGESYRSVGGAAGWTTINPDSPVEALVELLIEPRGRVDRRIAAGAGRA